MFFLHHIDRAPIPKRWQKPTPTTPSPFVEQNTLQTNNNFTVTTTVTFNVAKQQQQHLSEMEIPPRNNVNYHPFPLIKK